MGKRFAFGPFLLDTGRGTLLHDGSPAALGRRGLLILQALLEAQGDTVTKSSLLQLAWPGLVVEESNLSVQVAALRKLLGSTRDGAEWIVTVPRVGYRLSGAVSVQEESLETFTAVTNADPGGRPSIVVLPFMSLSDDPAHEYFVDGVTEDIIAALTRFRWFSVIGRNSSFVYKARPVDARTAALELGVRYLLEGTLRKSHDKVRIATQLVDARSGNCLWADRYDFDVGDLFAVQDEVAQRVAGSLEPELLKSAGGLAASRRRPSTTTGWDLVAQGSWYFHHVTKATHLRARELFRQACQLDPELTEARLWLGRVSAGLVAYGWTDHPVEDLREGLNAALQAVEMDEKNPYAHYALAITSAYSDSHEFAMPAAEKALELSPSFALGHLALGMARLFSGHAEVAVNALERGLQLNRYDPQNFVWYKLLALAYLFSGRAEEGVQRALSSLKIRPTWRPSMETAAACYAALGQTDVAHEWQERIARLPKVSGDALQPLWRRNPRWAAERERLLPRYPVIHPGE